MVVVSKVVPNTSPFLLPSKAFMQRGSTLAARIFRRSNCLLYSSVKTVAKWHSSWDYRGDIVNCSAYCTCWDTLANHKVDDSVMESVKVHASKSVSEDHAEIYKQSSKEAEIL